MNVVLANLKGGGDRQTHLALLVGTWMDVTTVDVERLRETLKKRADRTAALGFEGIRLVSEETAKKDGHVLCGGRKMANDVSNVVRNAVRDAGHKGFFSVDDVERQKNCALADHLERIDVDDVVFLEDTGFGDAIDNALIFGDEFFLFDTITGVEVQRIHFPVAGQVVHGHAVDAGEVADDLDELEVLMNFILHELSERFGPTAKFAQEGSGVDGVIDQMLIDLDTVIVLVDKTGEILDSVVTPADIVIDRNDRVGHHTPVSEIAISYDDVARMESRNSSQHLVHEEICGMEVVKYPNFHLSSLLSYRFML